MTSSGQLDIQGMLWAGWQGAEDAEGHGLVEAARDAPSARSQLVGSMPTNELGEHQQLGGLPPSLTGCQPVWCVRYTGEIFTDYE
jgi:hypothetical protein